MSFKYFTTKPFFETLIVIVFTICVFVFIKRFLIKKVAYRSKDTQHANTFIGVVFSILQYLVGVAAIFIILKINGVNVTGIVAGLGIVATIVGLALQDTLKDLISGINIYNNNFYKVGDIVKYNDENCEVKFFNARVTKFRSLKSDATYTVCNSEIRSIEKVKDKNSVAFTFDFATDPKKIDKLFESIIPEVEAVYGVSDVKYLGAFGFGSNGVKYGVSFKGSPRYAGTGTSLINKRVYEECYKAKIHIKFEDEYILKMPKGAK